MTSTAGIQTSRQPLDHTFLRRNRKSKAATQASCSGSTKGARNARFPSQVLELQRWPSETVLTWDLEEWVQTGGNPSVGYWDYHYVDWPQMATQNPVPGKMIDYRRVISQTGVIDTAHRDYLVDMFTVIGLGQDSDQHPNIPGGQGHPPVSVLHFDEVGLPPQIAAYSLAVRLREWTGLVEVLTRVKINLNAAGVGVSINFGGWGLYGQPNLKSSTTILNDIISMCNYCSLELVPHPRVNALSQPPVGGLDRNNYQEVINNLNYLMSAGVTVELQPSIHLADNSDHNGVIYKIVDATDTTDGGPSALPASNWNANGSDGAEKVLITLDRDCKSCNPHLAGAPGERFHVGKNINDYGLEDYDNPISGMPLAGWSAWPGPQPNQMYIFRRDETRCDTELRIVAHCGSFDWKQLKGQAFIDFSCYERMQAITLMLAAPSLNNSGGVHYSFQTAYPDNMPCNQVTVANRLADWRLWGRSLSGTPGGVPIVNGPATGMATTVSRQFGSRIMAVDIQHRDALFVDF